MGGSCGQVELTHTFVASARSQNSLCHQMLMGSGKTTVVGPLVAMILAETGCLVTSVVPTSLLTFAQSVLRSTLVCTLHRRVLTLHFSRYTQVRRFPAKPLGPVPVIGGEEGHAAVSP